MNEEEQRAQKFVERHFPIAAAFLAAEPAEGEPPVFGPTGVQNAHDDQSEPYVVVRVAYRLSRFELFAALADGYATTNTGADPDSMTVQQIRSDVEAYLCGASWRDMEALVETVAGQIEGGEHPEQMAAMKRAMDRAFPLVTPGDKIMADLPSFSHPVQPPRYGDGTVTLQTTDRGEITIDEPSWCAGHDGDIVGTLDEISHNGAEITVPFVTARNAPSTIMSAQLSHAPYLTRAPEPFPVLYVELDEHVDLDVPDGRNLSRALRLAAVRLDRALDDLARLRGDHR